LYDLHQIQDPRRIPAHQAWRPTTSPFRDVAHLMHQLYSCAGGEPINEEVVTTNVRLDREVHRRLKYLAAGEGRSLSDVLREATAEYVARREGAIPAAALRDDPFFAFLARVDAEEGLGDADLASAHDRHLYGPEVTAKGTEPRPEGGRM